MNAADLVAKLIFLMAVFLVILCSMTGCGKLGRIGDTYNGANPEEIEADAREAESVAHDRPLPKNKHIQDSDISRLPQQTHETEQEEGGLVVNLRKIFSGNKAQPAVKKASAPVVEMPAPELQNVNKYARALEEKLTRRYNNTPDYSGKIAKVQLLPMNKPEVSLDGKKMRMRWSQVVYDIWGKRVADLEKEYYVVTFGDGRPLMQRTRPTITVGMNNEGGYAEFNRVRGGALSGIELKSGPDMFDKPDSEKTSLLDDNLNAKDSADAPYMEYDLPEARNFNPPKGVDAPVIPPASQPMQAMVVLEEM